MKSVIALFVLTLPTIAISVEGDPSLPFRPVHAADQAVVTSKSLQEELDQFRGISQWIKASQQRKSGQVKLEQAQREFEYAKTLREAGTISEVNFAKAFLVYRQLMADSVRLPIEVIQAEITGQFHMYRVLEEGNPGVDHRSELSDVVVKGLKLEIESLTNSLELAKTTLSLAQDNFDHGKKLRQKSSISNLDFERRTQTLKLLELDVEHISQQIAIAQTALKNFEHNSAKIKQSAGL